MDSNCKPIHAHAYTIPRSVEQHCEFASPSFEIPKKNGTIKVVTDFRNLNFLLKHTMSTISYSKDWGHDPFNGRVYLCFSIGLKYVLLSNQT
jgi:hypothetical protein